MPGKPYFEKFPFLEYELQDTGNNRTVINILQRVKVRDELKKNYLIFYEYEVKDGETHEQIAHKLYGDTKYHWLVLLVNDIVDPYFDWPMSHENLNITIRERYSTPEKDGLEFSKITIHHYEDAFGNVIDEVHFHQLPYEERKEVYIYEWERDQNEAKRKIQLLDERYVDQIDLEMEKLMNERPLR